MVYVNHILMASNSKRLVEKTTMWHSSPFDMKDMVEAAYIVGIKSFRIIL